MDVAFLLESGRPSKCLKPANLKNGFLFGGWRYCFPFLLFSRCEFLFVARGAPSRPRRLGLLFGVGFVSLHVVSSSEWAMYSSSRAGAPLYASFPVACVTRSSATGLDFCSGLTPFVILLRPISRFCLEPRFHVRGRVRRTGNRLKPPTRKNGIFLVLYVASSTDRAPRFSRQAG